MGITDSKQRPTGTFDSDLEFKDSAAVTASGAAEVDAAAQIVDVGTGLFKGCMIIDVSAMLLSDNDEIYDIVVQGSSDDDFGTDTNIVELAAVNLSPADVKRTDCNKDDAVGRYKLYFDNENNGTYYQYLRLYTVVAGTTTSITYSAFCVPMQ